MAKIVYQTEGISVEIEGDEDKVKAMAAQLQGGAQQDTLGKLLSGADSNDIQMIAKSLGYEKFNASKTLGALSLLKKFL